MYVYDDDNQIGILIFRYVKKQALLLYFIFLMNNNYFYHPN